MRIHFWLTIFTAVHAGRLGSVFGKDMMPVNPLRRESATCPIFEIRQPARLIQKLHFPPHFTDDVWRAGAKRFNELLEESSSGSWRMHRWTGMCDGIEKTGPSETVVRVSREQPMTKTESSVVFPGTLVSRAPIKKVTIKYMNNCPVTRSTNPIELDELLMEYVLMQLLPGVAPKAYALSAPAFFTWSDWRVDPRVQKDAFGSCSSRKSTVRGMVHENGTSLRTHIRAVKLSVDRIRAILASGKAMIEMLKKLHEVGFIHGDIQASNVVANKSNAISCTCRTGSWRRNERDAETMCAAFSRRLLI
jgi:hypothetical protein